MGTKAKNIQCSPSLTPYFLKTDQITDHFFIHINDPSTELLRLLRQLRVPTQRETTGAQSLKSWRTRSPDLLTG